MLVLLPATPLSRAHEALETGGFASPPCGGFALALRETVERLNREDAKCLNPQTVLCVSGKKSGWFALCATGDRAAVPLGRCSRHTCWSGIPFLRTNRSAADQLLRCNSRSDTRTAELCNAESYRTAILATLCRWTAAICRLLAELALGLPRQRGWRSLRRRRMGVRMRVRCTDSLAPTIRLASKHG